MENKENVIIKLTFQFALAVIKYCENLQENKKFVIELLDSINEHAKDHKKLLSEIARYQSEFS